MKTQCEEGGVLQRSGLHSNRKKDGEASRDPNTVTPYAQRPRVQNIMGWSFHLWASSWLTNTGL